MNLIEKEELYSTYRLKFPKNDMHQLNRMLASTGSEIRKTLTKPSTRMKFEYYVSGLYCYFCHVLLILNFTIGKLNQQT